MILAVLPPPTQSPPIAKHPLVILRPPASVEVDIFVTFKFVIVVEPAERVEPIFAVPATPKLPVELKKVPSTP